MSAAGPLCADGLGCLERAPRINRNMLSTPANEAREGKRDERVLGLNAENKGCIVGGALAGCLQLLEKAKQFCLQLGSCGK